MKSDKLKNIAPTLWRIKLKKNCHTVPDNYFNLIENSVFLALRTGKIDASKDKTSIPINYFDTLEDRVFSKLQKDKSINKHSKLSVFQKQIITRFIPVAIAASFILFFAITNLKNNKSNINNISSNTIQKWIDEDYVSLNSYEISSIYNDVNLEDDKIFELLDKKQISNYLYNKDIEYSNLEN